ncbi:MAG TPA: DNA polymerase I [Chthonomonadaceae bacterium]|nr:DNA polymerase I [Chthonomonadaceae bacterium]
MPETLYLIDGYAQIFRAYYAIRGGMNSPVTSEPTHAVFGFTGMLLKLFAQFQPHYVVVAVDAPGPTFRDALYQLYAQVGQPGVELSPLALLPPLEVGEPSDLGTEAPALAGALLAGEEPEEISLPMEEGAPTRYAHYKGTRRATPDDLTSQVDRIFEVIEGFGIPILGLSGIEADDVIATITQRVLDNPAYRDVNIRIVSKDKDLEQLIGDRVSLFDIHTDTVIDAAALQANKGITPAQVVDVLALMGDNVDNVPGVEGIGPKTAAQLVQQFGSLESLMQRLDEVKGKRRENLERAQGYLPISKALVTLKRDAELPFSLERARVGPIHLQKLIPLFRELGFNRFQEEARQLAAAEGTPAETAPPPSAATSTPVEEGGAAREADTETPYETATAGDYEAITTRGQLEALVAELRSQPLVSVDTETTGLGRDAKLCGLSFSWRPGHGVYVPVLSPTPEAHLDTATVLSALKPLLEDPDLPKCGHNLKFDAQVLLREGVHLRGVAFDTMLASILLDPAQSGHKLDNLALLYLHYCMIPISDLIGGNAEQVSMDQVPLPEVTVYAAEDTDIALRLAHALQPEMEARGLASLLRDIEAPLTTVLAEMEANGILCDPEELKRQGEALKQRVDELRGEVQAAAGCTFQIESTQQLAEVLFDRLGYASPKKTKTGRSTDITVLEKLAAQEDRNDPRTAVPRLVIEYRQLTKLISTYLGNLIASIQPEDGRIHSTFHQLVTATGRLASHNPNLQNIPVRTDIGRQIRKAFYAPRGSLLICADYSQVELRLLAHLSQDPALLEAFEQGLDIHTAVASQVFGVAPEQVTKEQRARAKTINFGIIYGITAFGLSRRIEGMDVATAMELIAQYRQRFPGIERFLQQCVRQALEQGYVCTLTGRFRAIPEIHSPNRNERNLGERLAINSVVQGSAADLIKAAMVNVQRRIDRDHLPLKMLLQIHDELILETPADRAEEYAALVCAEMERAMTLTVPLRAEAGIGPDWLSAR